MAARDLSQHPCFNKKASCVSGRVHLPVAPACNVQCNYCDRRYDCVNESRPGVTSAVLSPEQAVEWLDRALAAEPRIKVAGIAGPGDAMADPARTLRTLSLLKERRPELLFCLSSNGLNLAAYAGELAGLGVTHATVTMSAVDPEIGKDIYAWVRVDNVLYHGLKAGEIMIDRQQESIRRLRRHGIAVKVNTIVIPGVTEDHCVEVARQAASLGAAIHNLIPLKPAPGTVFGRLGEPCRETLVDLRRQAGAYVPQMTHCRRCRSDAVGLLHKDRSGELSQALKEVSRSSGKFRGRPHVAVASREGMLVNQHLGEAASLQIWTRDETGDLRLVEKRRAPRPGTGPRRWKELAELLSDCRAVLASKMGETPRKALEESGAAAHVVTGLISENLKTLYAGGDMSAFAARSAKTCAASCSGGGEGCG
ncbi:MAG: radical SAM protein [Desulfovibrionaceae bacterium]